MINASRPNYSETLSKIEELKDLVEELEEKFSWQVPQGITNELTLAKKDFLNWIEEAEFTIENYKKYD
ncbi:MAG: hypothetical protein NUV98_07150 [Candidatus Roizmanbacteria bacterium]|nr:hypothetical protein [Candidatus Roizmanbacteria bacterium]